MKYISFIILIYNFISLKLLYLNWTYERVSLFGYETQRCVLINFIDIPFYLLFAFVFFKWLYNIYKGNHYYLTNFQIYCTFGCIAFLLMIWINTLCECIKLHNIIFWGNFIILFTFFAYACNYLKFKK